ncbi:PfkB family carbohydrate kinase [Rhizobium sp. TRM95111]|uniref:PfkB family carbohydrate kinase n=1 Tax=Rhizobium alarense TaxID=2846851 RepID=UPI001F1DBA3D|nr:PfkB family carbohydrate kinase [Rhizobium alarense]MCF3642052.1 PfkB family carbohydrate kinase [Rhizobium alarense]
MSPPFHVLGFGAVSVDDIIYVDRPLASGKGKVTKRATDHGGNVATALVAIARLGGHAAFIGWLSDRPPDDVGRCELERGGVDTSLAPRHADAAPIRSVVIVDPNGDRFIAYDDDVPHGTSQALPDHVLKQAPVLLIDGYATHCETVVARARALGLAIVADIEWTAGSATDRIMALADHLVLPLAFGQASTGESVPLAVLDKLWTEERSAVVLTDGDHGSYVRQRDDATRWHFPAYEVQAIDTTGAGDCYHGAYCLALAQGKAPLDCVAYATAAAAISVTARGGRMGLPDNRACLARMAGMGAPAAVPIAG